MCHIVIVAYYITTTDPNENQVMQNGRIAQAGKFEDLLKQNIGFEVLVGAHSKALESIIVAENSSRTNLNSIAEEGESNFSSKPSHQHVQTQHDSVQDNPPEGKGNDGKLVQEEERETGSIAKEVYWEYLTKGGFWFLSFSWHSLHSKYFRLLVTIGWLGFVPQVVMLSLYLT